MGLLDRPAPTPSEELKSLTDDVRSALQTLKEANETKNAETLKKVEDFFSKYEDENAKFAKDVAQYKKAETELLEKVAAAEKNVAEAKKGTAEYKERVEKLELLIATRGESEKKDDAAQRETSEYKTFFNHLTSGSQTHAPGRVLEIKSGKWNPADLDVKTLRTDSQYQGGFLIPQVMDNEIRRHIIEVSPVRDHARVRTSQSISLNVPIRLAIPTAQFEGEAESAPQDQSYYGSETVTLYRQTVQIPATLDMMVSSAFDLEKEIAADVGTSFAQGEALNFVTGNGRKSPQGMVTDARCPTYTTAASGAVDVFDFAKLAGSLKRGQNPWFYLNRKSLAYVQSLKTSIGAPIWQPVAGNQPATIWGYPYDSNFIDLDDILSSGVSGSGVSGNKPVLFADLMRGYEIYDMMGMNVVRDDLTQATKAITLWTFRRYLTGRVILPEAIGIMKIQ